VFAFNYWRLSNKLQSTTEADCRDAAVKSSKSDHFFYSPDLHAEHTAINIDRKNMLRPSHVGHLNIFLEQNVHDK
jgi:hypothetical protein